MRKAPPGQTHRARHREKRIPADSIAHPQGKGKEKMRYLDVEQVMELLKVGKTNAYAIIRKLNRELESRGYMTIRGKIPEAYLRERFYSGGAV